MSLEVFDGMRICFQEKRISSTKCESLDIKTSPFPLLHHDAGSRIGKQVEKLICTSVQTKMHIFQNKKKSKQKKVKTLGSRTYSAVQTFVFSIKKEYQIKSKKNIRSNQKRILYCIQKQYCIKKEYHNV